MPCQYNPSFYKKFVWGMLRRIFEGMAEECLPSAMGLLFCCLGRPLSKALGGLPKTLLTTIAPPAKMWCSRKVLPTCHLDGSGSVFFQMGALYLLRPICDSKFILAPSICLINLYCKAISTGFSSLFWQDS